MRKKIVLIFLLICFSISLVGCFSNDEVFPMSKSNISSVKIMSKTSFVVVELTEQEINTIYNLGSHILYQDSVNYIDKYDYAVSIEYKTLLSKNSVFFYIVNNQLISKTGNTTSSQSKFCDKIRTIYDESFQKTISSY